MSRVAAARDAVEHHCCERRLREGGTCAKRSAPAPPYAPPSVETRTRVRCGPGRRRPGARTRARARGAPRYPRRCRRGPPRRRCRDEQQDDRLVGPPGHDRQRRWKLDAPERRRGSSVHTSSSDVSPRPRSTPRTSAPRPPALVPGTRDGYSVVSASARVAAASASKSGSSGRPRQRPVVDTENRTASSAGATTTNATRTRRVFTGRSTVPRRGRRLAPRGRAASIAGL